MKEWTEIRQWRKATRAELLAQRLAIPRSEKLFRRPIIAGSVTTQFPELRHACIGFYWPFKGEIDLRHLVRDFIGQGAEAARSEEHTSELQSLMRISYAVFCLKKKTNTKTIITIIKHKKMTSPQQEKAK